MPDPYEELEQPTSSRHALPMINPDRPLCAQEIPAEGVE